MGQDLSLRRRARNSDHVAATLGSSDGRLLEAWRWDLGRGNDSVQNAMGLFAQIAAREGVPVVAEDLGSRRV